MHITIYGIGGRGDVQPLIALGARLRRAGQQIRFVSHADFEAQARAHGLPFRAISGQPAAFFGGAAGRALRDRLASDPKQYRQFFDRYLAPFVGQILTECVALGADTDAVVSWPWMRVIATIAEKHAIPAIVASPVPNLHLPTEAFANPFDRAFRPGQSGAENLCSWESAKEAFAAGQDALQAFRRKMHLPDRDADEDYRYFQGLPHILGFSEHVLPKPHDWPEHVHVTGAWHLDDAERYVPPAPLKNFLDSGPAPIVIGFSSSIGANPREMTPIVVEAVRRSGKRAIFVAGFGGLKSDVLPDSIFAVDSAPYSWLLPRAAAIVHHAGAGSTSDGLRAGLPSLGIPFGWDQPLWASRIFELGVGCSPIPARHLAAGPLCDALVQLVEDSGMRRRAQSLGALLTAEDGAARAAEIVTRTIGAKREPLCI